MSYSGMVRIDNIYESNLKINLVVCKCMTGYWFVVVNT